ncbi:peptidylprolyl isomerase [Insolitispirillum peregrinum]|uniref:Parvulin-like PPIase n=1 Tax=Insolitispirillum peregrinum TaxID=80876 RepID=A0A1N7JXP4_9PROT|nr:peptidylprolyl isomerase [Insolitispirillum peregrinum]SIS54115.1 peptidyl-prolyl cis-trans isomerase C [Insolitispirillum peregrinum]
MLKTALRAAAAATVFLMAAAPAFAADDPVVAKVDGSEIHRSEIVAMKDRMAQQMPQIQAMPLESIFANLVDQAVSQRLLLSAAKKANVADDAEFKKQLDQVRDSLMQRAFLTREVEKRLTDDKLRTAYDDLLKNNPPEDEVHARHILVDNEKKANELIKKLKKGASFEDLAKSDSKDDGSGKRGGDLGYFSKSAMVPEFAEAAFAMKPGDVSDKPVKTQFGWHIIKVEDRRKSTPPAFEEVKEQLRGQMADGVIDEIVGELRKNAKVEITAPEAKTPDAK